MAKWDFYHFFNFFIIAFIFPYIEVIDESNYFSFYLREIVQNHLNQSKYQKFEWTIQYKGQGDLEKYFSDKELIQL